ncbi:MAG: hypothetical protein GF309_07085 [Candidatus Lokiarchaeota archaeon]|jgi:rubrerythrin|nr:hypothetical protein [Candidatus Lokiarchaeota archaeon]
MNSQKTIDHMLRVALATALNHFDYYQRAADEVRTTEVKALLLVLAEAEEDLIDRIEDMLATGIVEEIESLESTDDIAEPNPTPFDPQRAETDPRLYVCNRALEQEVKGYNFFLSLAVRSKSDIVSRLFEYFATRKAAQIESIRRVCSTF